MLTKIALIVVFVIPIICLSVAFVWKALDMKEKEKAHAENA